MALDFTQVLDRENFSGKQHQPKAGEVMCLEVSELGRADVRIDGVEYQTVSRFAAMNCASSLGFFPRSSEIRYSVAPCLMAR